ncbi:hypothetical protein BH09VER1_BH09VER1_03650 [soil metagenome]
MNHFPLRNVALALLGTVVVLGEAGANEFYVDNEKGSDSADGLAAKPDAGSGPVKTLAKAVALLTPGDTLNLVATATPYHETIQLNDVAGTAGHPIIIDGHGATITGCDPLRDDWVPAGDPGLYKSDQLLGQLQEANEETKLQRMFFIFDGVQQRMGRTSKGTLAKFKPPSELQPGEWSYDAATRSFYVKVEGTLADAKVEAPYRQNGVALRGRRDLEFITVRNLVCVHVLNDGFNLHGYNVRNVRFENIAAYENGDDGYSPHEDVESSVDGYWASGNSTGVALALASKTKMANMRLEGNFANEYITGIGGKATTDEVTNSVIIASAGGQPFQLGKHQDGARVKFDNVQISSPDKKLFEISERGIVEGRRLTVVGPSWNIGGTAEITESAIGGKSLDCLPGSEWKGEKNVYDIKLSDKASSGSANCTAGDVSEQTLKVQGQPFPGAGANPAEFKIPPRLMPNPAAGKFTTIPPLN